MKKSVFICMLVTTGFFSCGQVNTPPPKTDDMMVSKPSKNIQHDKDVYKKYVYADSKGKRVIIENGFPKGGMRYTDPDGHACGYAVFWTMILNETDTPLECMIHLPDHSYEISNFPGKHFNILVPADTLTQDEIGLYSYGLTDIDFFLNNNIHKPTSIKRTIPPKESSGFYFIILIHTEEATGMTRTGLSLKGQDLFYTISRYSSKKPISLVDEKEIHCGSINLKNLKPIAE